MLPHRVKAELVPGTNGIEITKNARRIFKSLTNRTKRMPYVRSAYFHKEKIFLNFFWSHLNQKPSRERQRRLKYLLGAIEVICYSRQKPTIKINPNRKNETFYRFAGITHTKQEFFVQIKQQGNRKYLMSVFPN